jgi:hypothetical protein
MYPGRDLKRLADRKAALQRQIHERREESAAAFERISRPLAWLDAALEKWRRLSPMIKLAAVPILMLLKRWIIPRTRVLGSMLKWGPLAYSAVRGLAAGRRMANRA